MIKKKVYKNYDIRGWHIGDILTVFCWAVVALIWLVKDFFAGIIMFAMIGSMCFMIFRIYLWQNAFERISDKIDKVWKEIKKTDRMKGDKIGTKKDN